MAMREWVEYPQAETALSNILPCVDEQTTNHTLYQSKEVIYQLVNVVNTAIDTIANSNSQMQMTPYYYNQSGPLMPTLCCPFDSQLKNRQCEPQEVSFANASMVCTKFLCFTRKILVLGTPRNCLTASLWKLKLEGDPFSEMYMANFCPGCVITLNVKRLMIGSRPKFDSTCS